MHEYDRQTDSGTVTSMPIGEITFQQCRLIIVVDTTKNCLVLDVLSCMSLSIWYGISVLLRLKCWAWSLVSLILHT